MILFILGHTGITLGVAGVAAGLEGGTPPDGLFTIALVIGANLPDLIDKPIGVFFRTLAWARGGALRIPLCSTWGFWPLDGTFTLMAGRTYCT